MTLVMLSIGAFILITGVCGLGWLYGAVHDRVHLFVCKGHLCRAGEGTADQKQPKARPVLWVEMGSYA